MGILVTGGAGYIGSHTAKLLAAAGHEPVIFDDLSQGHEWAVKWGPLERGNLKFGLALFGLFLVLLGLTVVVAFVYLALD